MVREDFAGGAPACRDVRESATMGGKPAIERERRLTIDG
jgi:hypothetical protein